MLESFSEPSFGFLASQSPDKAELNKESSDDVFVKGIRSTLNKLTVADSSH